jgi:hypothetical protein
MNFIEIVLAVICGLVLLPAAVVVLLSVAGGLLILLAAVVQAISRAGYALGSKLRSHRSVGVPQDPNELPPFHPNCRCTPIGRTHEQERKD